MEDSKSLFYSSKLPWIWERISSKFIDNLARVLKKVRQRWYSDWLQFAPTDSISGKNRDLRPRQHALTGSGNHSASYLNVYISSFPGSE